MNQSPSRAPTLGCWISKIRQICMLRLHSDSRDSLARSPEGVPRQSEDWDGNQNERAIHQISAGVAPEIIRARS
jgi:hypothetical protein